MTQENETMKPQANKEPSPKKETAKKPTRKKEEKPRRTKNNPTAKTRTERTLEVLQLVESQGISVLKACNQIKISRGEFFEEIDSSPELTNKYARARERRYEILIEEVIDIADDETQDKVPFYGQVKVKRDNLRIDARLKYLATLSPKKYGTQRMEIAGDKENPLQTVVLNLGSGIKPPEEDEQITA